MIVKTKIQCHRCHRFEDAEFEQEKYDHDTAMEAATKLARAEGWMGENFSTMLCPRCIVRSEFGDHEEGASS